MLPGVSSFPAQGEGGPGGRQRPCNDRRQPQHHPVGKNGQHQQQGQRQQECPQLACPLRAAPLCLPHGHPLPVKML